MQRPSWSRRAVALAAFVLWCAASLAAPEVSAGASSTSSNAAPAVSDHELRLAGVLAAGGLPRDRAMHAYLLRFHRAMGHGAGPAPSELREAAAAAPRDRLVQWLWANADDAVAGCVVAAPCPDRVRALAILEPDNGLAWVPALDAASRRGDAAGMDDILGRMADATHFEDLFVDSAEAWYAAEALVPILPAELAAIRADGDPRATGERWAIYAAIARAAALPMPSLAPLLDACNVQRDANAVARRDACTRIGRGMMQGNSAFTRSFGYAVLRKAGAATPADAASARRTRWVSVEGARVQPSMDTDEAALRRYFADLVATRDEFQAMERRIVRARGRTEPPVDWERGWPPLGD